MERYEHAQNVEGLALHAAEAPLYFVEEFYISLRMTLDDFINQVPAAIEHPSWGHCELRIINNTELIKGACYQDRNKRWIGVSRGDAWVDVYQQLSKFLEEQGIIKIQSTS
jgi:hypothetical protein